MPARSLVTSLISIRAVKVFCYSGFDVPTNSLPSVWSGAGCFYCYDLLDPPWCLVPACLDWLITATSVLYAPLALVSFAAAAWCHGLLPPGPP